MICFGQVVAAIVDAAFGEVSNDLTNSNKCHLLCKNQHFLFAPDLLAKVKDGWKYDFGLAGIPSVILLVGFYFCPESPR